MKSFSALDKDKGEFAFLFANGKGVRVPVSAYVTKSNRRRLTGAYSDASPCVGIFYLSGNEDKPILLCSDAGRGLVFSSALLPLKTTRTSAGNVMMTLKAGQNVCMAETDFSALLPEASKYRKTKLPSSGTSLPEGFILPEIKQ